MDDDVEKRSAHIDIRITPAELDFIRECAGRAFLKPTEWARQTLLRAAHEPVEAKKTVASKSPTET